MYKNNELSYVGNVGTGFTETMLQEIRLRLEPLKIDAPPFKNPPKLGIPVIWVKPEIVCEVRFSEWTKDNIIRQPVFLGIREDKPPIEVTKEKKIFFSPDMKREKIISIEGHPQKITNLEKKYWPDEGYTKIDLINYYQKISSYILPYLKNRPQSLHRYPDGIQSESFYHKNVKDLSVPHWIKTVDISSDSQHEKITYLLCQNKETLIYLANLGCIELNVWNARIPEISIPVLYRNLEEYLDKPDYFVFDLDPLETSFENVIKTALALHDILEKLKIKNFCKTSGATGLHVYIPLGALYTYDQAEKFGKIINFLLFKELPLIASMERSPERGSKARA